MPFGIGIAVIAKFVIAYAPDIIETVSRLLAGRPGVEKRGVAAKELFEVIVRALAEDWEFAEISDFNKDKLMEAIKDEDEFVERLAKVNDAIYEFTKYVNEQEVD